ncbi:MAG: bifunctional phosphoribosylaminoimidazolecarboxamide formyltransferase/IMP cyclohydrolase [Candidatus Omnitrophica bacterium]|nr:bifunctional phosphoribosylaminoimidazolecarboxamide formyltransferase/IMP cyclohydrolase [Candidatus Omnitrophota bacterium]
MKVKRALISVYDKTGLEPLAFLLHALGVQIISTGGTAKLLKSLNIPVVDIADHTGYPEMLDGRVKTLNPVIHAGLLSQRDNSEHRKVMEAMGIPYIDMVVVNLYPFEMTVSRPGVTFEEALENIDIGGPSMLRSASKNFKSVAVVSSPGQYPEVIRQLNAAGGEISEGTLKKLASEAFRRTSEYDGAINRYFSRTFPSLPGGEGADELLPAINIRLEKLYDLRYGENPHQKGALYKDIDSRSEGFAAAKQYQGKQLSFNNILDLGSALRIVNDLDKPGAVVVKHNNPSGAAMADKMEDAYLKALDCDRMSAFGGIMAFNREIDEKLAELILGEADFVECIISPGYIGKALEVFGKKKNLRVLGLPAGELGTAGEKDIKKVPGGFLVQDMDEGSISAENMKIVTKAVPSKEDMEALIFAWNIVRHVKSNAIVLSRGTATVGIGAGQMSRVDSVITAIRKAGERSKGSVLASDAFFPMPDSIDEAHKAGVRAVIQPGGSVKDADVIAACDRCGISMVFTGIRHFKH